MNSQIATESGNGIRIDYIDALRTIACFAVVMLHVSAQNTSFVDFHSHEWDVFMLYESVVNWAVPVFVMLSGAVMLRKGYERKELNHKLFRILLIFVIWSVIFLISDILRNDAVDYQEGILWLQALLQGHYHMWYLIMLCGLYLAVPVFRAIAVRQSALRCFVCLSVVFTFMIPSIKNLPQIVDITNALQIPVIGVLSRAFGYVTEVVLFHLTLGFAAYYVFGYYIVHCIHFDIKKQLVMGMILLIGGTLIVIMELRFSVSKDAVLLFLHYYQVGIAAQALGILLLAKGLTGKKIIRFLAKFSPLTLGIYMIHPLIIETLQKAGISSTFIDPIVAVPMLSVIVFMVSLLIVALIIRTPLSKAVRI